MGSSFTAIMGALGGAILLIGFVILLIWFCLRRRGQSSNRNSDTGSSDPSAVVELKRGEQNEARQFRIEELDQATRHFNESNLIGSGTFGLVFKGFLYDGDVVAIKRRPGSPQHEFIEEVAHLSGISHRNLVTLLGYCQESGYQMLVYEYLPNGSICNHLYDTRESSSTKLEFKQRLTIAVGAAKGLCHLHSLHPPTVHGNFKTANVLVDENFIAKVADAGVSKILEKIDATPSSSSSVNAFRDPELQETGMVCEKSDVYSFGVFLLELIMGREAKDVEGFGSNDSMLLWVQMRLNMNNLVDHQLVGRFTAEGMRDLIRLMLQCLHFPGRERPKMENVVSYLEQILEKEISSTTVMAEGNTTVTPGSQLFTT